jgi:hypothetical protein
MRKKIYQHRHQLSRYYKKFCNLQKRIRLLMQSGEFFGLSREIRHRLINRLELFYNRIERLAGKQRLRWAGAALALILSASAANAQFNDTISLSGFYTGDVASPTFVDLDDDGDQDIVIGYYDGSISFVVNNEGEYSYASDNPFNGFDVGVNSAPAFVDLDDDGDLDLVVGNNDGVLAYFRNDAGIYTELLAGDNPFNGIDVGGKSDPTFYDLDNDEDPDMIVGEYYGTLLYFRNDAGVFTNLTGTDNPFDGIWVDYWSSPTLNDLDEDGDYDLVLGEYYGNIFYYENDGGVFTEQIGTDNPFNGIILGYGISPVLEDVDLDDDLDLVVGEYNNTHYLDYLRNDAGVFTEKRGQPNPFEGILSGYSPGIVSPAFSDVDDDGDLDLLTGDLYAVHQYYENTSEGFVPKYGSDDPFASIPAVGLQKPVFVDLDNDGDEDLVIGDEDGYIHYFSKESAGDFYEMTGAANPFNLIDVGVYAAPAFTDIDDDGDLDLFVGGQSGVSPDEVNKISFFRNVSGSFFEITGTDNPFESLFAADPGTPLNPVFCDVDRDGDEDLFIGLKFTGIIEYAWNDDGTYAITDSRNPFLDMEFTFGVAPTFADVDEDGDKDMYVGGFRGDGGILYFAESTQGPPESVPTVEEDAIRIYSADKTIYLDAGDQLINSIEVFNLAGTLITSKIINAMGQYELYMSDAQSGLYLVRAYSNGEISTEKVLIR